ncbi:unnamed protein product, partial [Allacma fusca]
MNTDSLFTVYLHDHYHKATSKFLPMEGCSSGTLFYNSAFHFERAFKVEERYDRQMSMLNSATCYSEAVGQVKSIPSTDYITISKRYPAKQAWH